MHDTEATMTTSRRTSNALVRGSSLRRCDLYGCAQRRCSLARKHARERVDTAGVEGRARLLEEQAQGLLGAPRRAIDPRRDEGVVDIADREDAGVEIQRVGAQP